MDKWAHKLPQTFFALGFFTCTWDLLLKLDLFGFTFKIHGLFFALSLGSLFVLDRPQIWVGVKRALASNFFRIFLAITAFYAVGTLWSAYPLKTFLYSGWLAFNLVTIGISALAIQPRVSTSFFRNLVLNTALCLCGILLVDSVAYQFGFSGGLVGWNQDAVLNWGISRPSAFSSEPSFVAAFLSTAFLFLAPQRSSGKKNGLFYAALALIVLGIFLTTSRTGLLAILIGGVIFLVCHVIAKRVFPWKVVTLSLVALVATALVLWNVLPEAQRKKLDHELIEPIMTGRNASHSARLRSFGYAWQMARETNFLGTGLGASFVYWLNKPDVQSESFESKESELAAAQSIDRGKEAVMSTWGQILAEGGLVAVFLYLAAAISLVWSLFSRWRYSGAPFSLGGFLSASIFFFFTAFFLGNIARGDVWVWYALWNLALTTKLELGEDQS